MRYLQKNGVYTSALTDGQTYLTRTGNGINDVAYATARQGETKKLLTRPGDGTDNVKWQDTKIPYDPSDLRNMVKKGNTVLVSISRNSTAYPYSPAVTEVGKDYLKCGSCESGRKGSGNDAVNFYLETDILTSEQIKAWSESIKSITIEINGVSLGKRTMNFVPYSRGIQDLSNGTLMASFYPDYPVLHDAFGWDDWRSSMFKFNR